MKKKTIFLICGLLAVAVLAVGAWFLKNNLAPAEKTEQKDDYDVEQKYEREKSEIFTIANEALLKRVTVKNADDEYSVFKDRNGIVRIEGEESVPLLPASSTALYECPLRILSESTIELSTAHPEYYGLDKPQATMTVTIETEGQEGKVREEVFLLGDMTPDHGGYYFCKEGSKRVYAVSTYFGRRLLGDRTRLFSTDIYTIYSDPGVDADWLCIDRGEGDNMIARYIVDETEYRTYGTTFVFEGDYTGGANPDSIRDVFSSAYCVIAKEIVCCAPDEATLASYGFDNAVRVGIRMNVDISRGVINNITNPYFDPKAQEGETVAVTDWYTVGNLDAAKGVYYVMYNDGDVIYAVDRTVFDFISYDTAFFRQNTLWYVYLTDVKTLSVDYTENGERKSYSFDIFTKKNTEGETVLDYVTYQGVEIGNDDPSRESHGFKALYQDIIGIAPFGSGTDTGLYEPVMKVTLLLADNTVRTMEFVPIDEDELYYFVRIDGSGEYLTLSSRMEYIASDIAKLLAHENFDAHHF